MSMFKKATRKNVKLRMGLAGVSGSGKTFTALRIAHAIAKLAPSGNGRIAFLDSDRKDGDEDAHIYAGEENPDGGFFDFDTVQVSDNSPKNYRKVIKAAADEGYCVLIIDTLSHAWSGEGGALQMVDNASKRTRGNSHAAWRDVTPEHDALVTAMLTAPLHLIATMRSKMEYEVDKDDNGKAKIQKLGLAPIQRAGMEYEFDLMADMENGTNILTVGKTRFSKLNGGVFKDVGENVAKVILERLNSGEAQTGVRSAPVDEDVSPQMDPGPVDDPTPPTSDDHHPSFTADERKKFMAYIGELGFNYDEVKQICAAKGTPRPSTLSQDRRNKCALWLRDLAWERDKADVETQLKGVGMTVIEADTQRAAAKLPPLSNLTQLGRAEAVNDLLKAKSAASAAK